MRERKKTDMKAGADMTPMIDMVFQLLIFFILTLKIVASEGDFNIKMPLSSAATNDESAEEITSILIRLRANGSGNLDTIQIADRTFPGSPEGINSLRSFIRSQLAAGGSAAASQTEIELDCDYQLKYRNVILVISACTGYIEKGEIVRLAEKIKFRAPRARQ
ncbi:MAG: biopolymer transporter ExbD [Planctomycetia bacterium]|nr:biopolymer transporter ExbD [Planctomycetia bacterium]